MVAEIFNVHFAYKEWQAQLLLNAVRDLPIALFEESRNSSHGGIKGTLQHMYGADHVWLNRVQGRSVFRREDIKVPQTAAEFAEMWTPMLKEWKNWAALVSDWQAKITYTMFDGTTRSNPLWQIAMHVVNHGTLHGGQVVAMLRQAGIKPPQTDILFFYREMDA